MITVLSYIAMKYLFADNWSGWALFIPALIDWSIYNFIFYHGKSKILHEMKE